jgi:head-tail adaptor
MARVVPDGIERLTPSQAWSDGYRIGREDLAASMAQDAAVRVETDGRANERIEALERAMSVLRANDDDLAGRLVDIVRRLGLLEEKP